MTSEGLSHRLRGLGKRANKHPGSAPPVGTLMVVMRSVVSSLESGLWFSFPKACWCPNLPFTPSWLCDLEQGSHLFASPVLTGD